MAEKTEKKAGIERLYTINLRKEWLSTPLPKRSKRSVRVVRNFVTKHTKSKNIKLSKGINELILKRGFKKPPGKITVEVKGDREEVLAKLPGEVIVKRKEEKPKGGMAGIKERLLSEKGGEQGASPVTKRDLKETIKKKVAEETTKEKVKEIAERVEKEEKPSEKPEEPKKEEKPAENPKEEEKELEGKKADEKEPEKNKKKEEKPSKEEKK